MAKIAYLLFAVTLECALYVTNGAKLIKNHRFGIIDTAGVNFSALMAPAWPPPDRPMVPPCSGPSRRGLEALE
jgi:hypothetical protein